MAGSVNAECKTYCKRLTYAQEAWLFQQSPRAWGWHKALLYEPELSVQAAIKEAMPEQCKAVIKQAYERR